MKRFIKVKVKALDSVNADTFVITSNIEEKYISISDIKFIEENKNKFIRGHFTGESEIYFKSSKSPLIVIESPETIYKMIEGVEGEEECNDDKCEKHKHGYWKTVECMINGDKKHYIACSECGSCAFYFDSTYFMTDYCPYCGAKMSVNKKGRRK